jgi:hypothetical protein
MADDIFLFSTHNPVAKVRQQVRYVSVSLHLMFAIGSPIARLMLREKTRLPNVFI